jgi:hypothetical protein
MEKRPATAAAAPGPEVPCYAAEAAAQKDHEAMYPAFIKEVRQYNLDCEKRIGDMERACPTLHFTPPKLKQSPRLLAVPRASPTFYAAKS